MESGKRLSTSEFSNFYLKVTRETPFEIIYSGWTREELDKLSKIFFEHPSTSITFLFSVCWISCPWSGAWPLSLVSECGTKASGGQKREAAMVFAKSLILTMRKMQQSKYREVIAPIWISWIHKISEVK